MNEALRRQVQKAWDDYMLERQEGNIVVGVCEFCEIVFTKQSPFQSLCRNCRKKHQIV